MKITKKLNDLLNQFDWFFSIKNYDRELFIKEKDEERENGTLLAEISFDDEYQKIDLSIYPIFFKYKPKKQRKALLHEFIHTITIPSRDQALDLLNGKLVTKKSILEENERLTSKIENLLDLLLSNNGAYMKKSYKDYMSKDKHTKEKKKKKK